MATAVFLAPTPPPQALVASVEWGGGVCELNLSRFIYGAPVVLAGGGSATSSPLLACYPHFQVHRLHRDGRPRRIEIAPLPVSLFDTSGLAMVPGAAEAALSEVIRAVRECAGLPSAAQDLVAWRLLGYVREVAAWALRAGLGPLLTQVRADIHVRMISEAEAGTVQHSRQRAGDQGRQLPWVLPRAAPGTAAKVDHYLQGRSEEEDEGEEERCAICLETMSGKERRWLPCSHSFHGDCVGTWLRQRAQCPVCRHDLAMPPLPH